MNNHYDVVIIGCGVAGLSAAITAAEEGAQVAVLERSPKDVRGGNTRYTDAYLRLKNPTDPTDDFIERLSSTSSGLLDPELRKAADRPYTDWPPLVRAHAFADPAIVEAFASGVPGSMEWLQSFGVQIVKEYPPMPTRAAPRMAPVGGGLAIVNKLAQGAESLGVHFSYTTTGRSLKQDARGSVIGVNAWSPQHGLIDFHGNAVVLASGGFQGNPELMTRYIGPQAYLIRPVAHGGMYNKGEGIQMALSIGAAPAGQFDNFHAEPVDPRTSSVDPVIYSFSYGILVNQLGQRFIDEASGITDLIYEDVARTIWKQPGGKAYLIFDSKIESLPSFKDSIKSDLAPIRCKSLDDLAHCLGIPIDPLRETVTLYNASVSEIPFDPTRLDGKTTLEIHPPKSNWAQHVDGPDYFSYPLICANVFTFGGLKVTPTARVVNTDGYEIPGLYAAGETIGFYYRDYPGSTSVLRGLVFGRIAGHDAACYSAS
ncbi:FAD-dependent oxidoreductase [SAR202 cluster bacterium AD-804-J14_MRT_500m]|nr:FAD-dependent oxidoreductase [SAR202 cluster bacterium AD-804-J14_MRT_500m]